MNTDEYSKFHGKYHFQIYVYQIYIIENYSSGTNSYNTFYIFVALLYRQLCWYLTCENKNHYSWTGYQRAGSDSGTPVSNLHHLNHKTLIFVGMVIIMMMLLLGLVCAIVWMCFWQLELTGNRKTTILNLRKRNDLKYCNKTLNNYTSGECILKRRHLSTKNKR